MGREMGVESNNGMSRASANIINDCATRAFVTWPGIFLSLLLSAEMTFVRSVM